MLIGKLTDAIVSNLRARQKIYKVTDGHGMSLVIKPDGTKWWRLDFTHQDKRNSISLGVYPKTTLLIARQKRLSCREAINTGIHPKIARDSSLRYFDENLSFKDMAESWFGSWKKNKTKAHLLKIRDRLNRDIFPKLKEHPVKNINEKGLLSIIKDIETSGSVDKAHRVRQTLHQVFNYGIKLGILVTNPTKNLRNQQLSLVNARYPRITGSNALKHIMMKIKNYNGHANCKLALQFSPLVFVRPNVLLNSKWNEIHWDEKLWVIPADRSPNQSTQVVPLCEKAMKTLWELNPRKLKTSFIFHSHRGANIPLSANTLNHALAKIADNEQDRITVSGFRNIAETNLKAMGWSDHAIGAQLGKSFGNYIHRKHISRLHLSERRSMMVAWADYLESLTCSAEQISMYAAVRPKVKNRELADK